MSKTPELLSKTITDFEDGYAVTWDYGEAGTSRVRVYVPPHDPEQAARNRAEINRILARHGYKLVNDGRGERSRAPDAG